MNNEESFSTKHKRMQREMVKQAYIWGYETGADENWNRGPEHGWYTSGYEEELLKGSAAGKDLNDLYIKLGIEE